MPPNPSTLRALDPLLYLFGHRGAIERIAATPWAWVVGVVLVLSAGIARNYDHLDLLRDPEWIWGPFAASLVSTSFIFLCLLWILRPLKGQVWPEGVQRLKSFGTFLNLVWLTAPCAWLYGIPFESFTDLLTATKWNIFLLGLVSVWRVAIIVRAVSVLSGAPWVRIMVFVLAPASLEMIIGNIHQNMSLIRIMAGVRNSPSEELIMRTTGVVTWISIFCLVVALIAMFFTRDRAVRPICRVPAGFPLGALAAAAACLLLWSAIAKPFHHKVCNRLELQRYIEREEYDLAVKFASSRQRSDFSGLHRLPPDPYHERGYPFRLLDALGEDAPQWLRDEWTGGAIESQLAVLEGFSLSMATLRDDYPAVFKALADHAAELKGRKGINHEEKFWLSQYESAMERIDQKEEEDP